MPFSFSITKQDTKCRARTGVLDIGRGPMPTPLFMPVGTRGTVKAMTQGDLEAIGFPIILGNTYHLATRPGPDYIESAGGLHRFISWNGGILTDSGGYQVFSLAHLRKISDAGVDFRSTVDGAKMHFDPETVMDIQRKIGADIIMAFDECPPHPATNEETRIATERTHRWAVRCVDHWRNEGRPDVQNLFPIVQGGVYEDLRRESAEFIGALDTPGVAVGGVSVGEPSEEMLLAEERTVPYLPPHKPRYLMGLGQPEDILEAVERGFDMFDCVLPTRCGRNGTAYTSVGRLNLKGSKYAEDYTPLDEKCSCPVCARYSMAYIRHLVRSNEMLGSQLLTYHNLHFYHNLMAEIRAAIAESRFAEYKRNALANLLLRAK
ncbi:MAG TPA: tRNA guanosine(34) transglycosylase Tgt [Armatimonadota bacterium]|jgi:queuine tRNA-ribosyltransferase